MRKPSLTRCSKTVNGRLASMYDWRGEPIAVCDSARNALLVIELFGDDGLNPNQKSSLLVRMLFPDPAKAVETAGTDLADMLASVVWDAFGLDITAERAHSRSYEPAVFDWAEDAPRIRASLLQCYGIDWDKAASTIPYADLCALLGSLLESDSETPFQQAIYYRTAKPPKQSKHNADLRKAWSARANHFALGSRGGSTEAKNNAMVDMFASAKRAAKGA